MAHVNDDPALEPWQIMARDYPATGSMSERTVFLLRYVTLAPSSHNTQPWLFRVDDQGVQLRADRSRRLPVVDPDDRELIMSCGAALETFRVAARRFGQNCHAELLPDSDDKDLLARLQLEPGDPPSSADSELFDAVTRRRTNRRAYADRDVPDVLVRQLVIDAHAAGAWLHPIRGGDRQRIAALIARGDAIQMADKRFRRELAAWVHPNRSHHNDGMRGHGFGFSDLISHAAPLVIRLFDLGKGQAAKDRAHAERSPLLAVLGTETDGPMQWLAAGQALQLVLLRCCAAGVSAAFLNQPIETEELRAQLARETGRNGAPQLLLRLGYGPSVDPQPRRPISEVTESAFRGLVT